jgi:hypothetical protein
MQKFRPGLFPALTVLLGLLLSAEAPPASAQATPATAEAPPASAETTKAASRPKKSVYGKLESVNKGRNGVIMTSNDGKRLAWKFEPAVIAEVERIKPGDPMIVIYRQISSSDKRVTAVAFPGTADVATYVNMTGERVTLRSAPMVDGACGQRDAGPLQETTIPAGGVAETTEACWCCASADEACSPGNKTGLGRALLVQCFE